MPITESGETKYFIGFDGGGTKTDCVLADAQGRVLARAVGGPSNPLRSGLEPACTSLKTAAQLVLAHELISASHIRAICAGLAGAGVTSIADSVAASLKDAYPHALVHVTTDLDIAFESIFGAGEGILLVGGTGSAAFGRDENGRSARAGGRGAWISDEGGAFDIGRRAIAAAVRAEDGRGPKTELAARIFACHECCDWSELLKRTFESPDVIFSRTFPVVAEMAEGGDIVCRQVLADAAAELASLVESVAAQLGWHGREVLLGKVGGIFERSGYLDDTLQDSLARLGLKTTLVIATKSPAEAAAQVAIRLAAEEPDITRAQSI